MYAVARDWAKGGGGGGHATRAHDADARRGCHRANALHVLKFIVENKRFGDRVGGVLEECLCLATAGFRHPRWYIRNSSLMLFHAVLQRVVGAPTAAPSPSLCPSSPSGATWSDMGGGGTGRGGGAPTSLYDMATRTPRAVRFAYEELTHLVHARRGGRDRVPHSVALFPILHMLSMLAPDPPHLAGGSPGVRRSPPPPPHTHTHTHTHAQWDEGADSGGGGGASCYSSSSAVATMTACVPDGAAMARAVMDCLGAESWMIRAASARALLCLVPVPHRVRYVAVVQSRLREALRAHECRGVAEGGEGGGDGGGGVGECCTTWANRLNEIHGALLVLHEFHRRAVAAHPRCVHGGAVRPGVCATDQAGENAAAALAHVGHGETAAASCRAAHMPRKTPHADDCQVMWEMVVYPLLTARSALVAVCARCPILATAFMDLAVDALTHTPACLGPWNPTAPDTITTASHRLSEDATYRRATDTTSLCDTDSRCNEAGALSALADMAVEVMGRGCYGACVAGSKRPVSRRKDACRTTTTTPHTDRPSCRRAVCGRDVREACHAVPLRRRVGHTHALASAARVLWTVVRYDRLAIAGPTVNSAAPIVHDARTNSDDGGHGEEEEGSVGGGGTEAVRRDAHRGMDDFLSRAQGGLGCATSLWGVGVPTIFSSLFEYVSTHTRPDSRAVHSTSPHHTDPCARVGRRDDGGMQDEDDEDDRNRAAWPYRAEHDDSSGGGGGAGLFAPQDVTRVTRVLYTRYDCSLLALCLSGLWSVLVCGCSTHHHSHHSPRGLAVAAPMIQRDEGRVPTGERGRILCRCRGLRGLNALSWQAFTAHVRFLSCVHAEASTGALAGTECATQMDRLFHVLLDVVLLSSSSGTRESAAGPPLLRNSDAQSVVIVYLGRHARYALSVFDEQHSNREKERLSDVSRESRAMVPGMRFLGDSPPHVSHLYSDRSVWNSVPAAVHTGGVATTLDGVVAALMRYAQPDRCPRTRMAVLTALRDLLPAFHVPQDSASNDATHRRQEHSTACATDRPSSGNATEEDAPRGASAMLDNGGKRGVDAIVTTGEGETELVPASTTQSMRHMASGRRHTAQSVRARLLLVLLRLLCDDAHDIRQRACVVCSSTILRAGAAYGARDQMSCVLAVVLQLRAHAQRGEMTEGAFAQCFEDMLGGRSHDTARDNAATNVGRHENDESKASSSFSCAKDVTKEASRRSHRDANDGKDTGSSEDDEDDEEVEEEEDALFTREVDNMFIETTMVRYWHSRIFATAAVSVSFPVLDDLLDDAIRHDRAEVVIA